MKKKISLFFIIPMLVLCLFTLSSCKQKKWVSVDLLNYYENGIIIEYSKGTTTLKFYMDPTSGYDVDDYKEVKITYRIVDGDDYSKRITKKAYAPEGARGNPELQYFYIVLEKTKIDPEDKFISMNKAKGVLKSDETMVDDPSTASIPQVLLIGVIVLVIASIASCLGLSTRDDGRGQALIVIANVLPIAINIYMYVVWGALRGIIFSIFCVAIIAVTIIASRYID